MDSDDEDDLSKMDMGGRVSDLLFFFYCYYYFLFWNQKQVIFPKVGNMFGFAYEHMV